MAESKKVLEREFSKTTDPTNQPQATTAEDVNAQDARTRLWQSLNYTYGQQRKQSDLSYDQAYSQADRQALSRGMQRSSYTGQTLANLSKQKVDAQNDIYSAQIADYQNRLGEIEQQERQQENWEKEFNAGREDAAWNKEFQQNQFNYQKEQDKQTQANWQAQFDFTQKQWEAQQDQWKQEFDYNKMSDDQKLAYNYVTSILGQGGNPSDDLLARAGLTRADADAMKAKVSTGSSGGRSRGGNNNGENSEEDQQKKYQQLMALLSGSYDIGEGAFLGASLGTWNARKNSK